MEQLPIGRTQTRLGSPSMRRGTRRVRAGRGAMAAAAALLLLLVISLAGPISPMTGRVLAQSATLVPGSTYTVQPGDSWTSLARRTGLTIRQLQAANPQAVRDSGWLIVGEELTIPGAATASRTPTSTPTAAPSATATNTPDATPTVSVESTETEAPETEAAETEAAVETATEAATGEQTYVVQPGESWNSIAQKFGVSADALRAANPQAVRPGLVLFRNEELTIPSATGSTPQPTTEPTEAAEATGTAPAPTEAAGESTPAAETATEEVATEPTCPGQFALFPSQLEELAAGGDMESIIGFLTTCDVLDDANLRSGDWNGDGIDDWAITLLNPRSDSATPETEMLVFMSGDAGYSLSFQARPAGKVSLLAAEDINLDEKPDLAWVDTTCGASTCFDTVAVRSWDGGEWVDWTDSTIVMAYSEIKLDEVRDTAQGREIVLNGGEYGSVGAGPQRARTETWGSVDGAPYQLLDKVYERSNCLYFKVLDANEALTRVSEIGLVQAREMYNEAVTNRNLVKCAERDNELDELRSFSLFRLAVVYAYEGDTALAAETVAQLADAYPDTPYAGMADAWLAAYEQNGDPADACAAATTYAEQYPETFEALSDYGYANPSFTAADLCPVLDIASPTAGDTSEAGDEGTPEVGATESITPLMTLTVTTDTAGVAPVVPGQAGELPDCPTTLDGYATSLPQVITVSEGDPLVVETWLRLCDGMADDRGGMLLADFNGDDIEDALFLPTIVSDLGFGPGGAQGAVLVYHGTGDGSYELVDAPAVYGQPTLLAADDLNGDGRLDIAWTVEGCSTFCVKEVQAVTWDPETSGYVSIIEPGATIAEGAAEVIDLPEGAPGQGKQLTLRGGVSGTSEGGIEIEHEEAWQSIDGRAFRRLSWTYDRENSSSNCLGLRLVEADTALHAADILGYALAIELYRAALDPALNACSIFGVPAPEELKLLQGLAMFRLVQAQALAGDSEAAEQDLAALQQGQPESAFANAAQQWLDAYTASQDAADACGDLQPLFDKETLTWQITDHFGFNHPALAPEQVCFTPRAEE